VSNKPGHRGEREVSRKTIARGMPDDFRCDRGDYARVFVFYHTRGCGCIARPAFPAPSDFLGGWFFAKTRTHRAARTRSLVLEIGARHCEERSEEAIHSSICGANYGLLRGACHRARVRATRSLAMTVLRLPLDLSPRGMVVSLIVCGLPKLATPGDAPGSAFVNLNRRYVDLRLKSGISHEY